jgi:hypothetical protein
MVPLFVVEKLKSWALTFLAVLAVLVGAYAIGGRKARRAAEAKHNYDEALRAGAGAKGVHDVEVEVRKLPTGGAADQLRRDWMRNDSANANAGGTGVNRS